MSWDVWGPAILAGVVTSGAGSFLVKLLVEKSVAHAFERQIENLKSDLKLKEAEIGDLKSGALSAISSRQAEIDRHRLSAANALWVAVSEERKYRTLVQVMTRLNVAEIKKAIKNDPVNKEKMSKFAQIMWKISGMETLSEPHTKNIDSIRLHCPARAWLLYDALRTISAGAIATIGSMKEGGALDFIKDEKETVAKIVAALPQKEKFLMDNPEVGPYYITDDIEAEILKELLHFVDADDSHLKVVENASKVIAHARKVSLPKEIEGIDKSLTRELLNSENS